MTKRITITNLSNKVDGLANTVDNLSTTISELAVKMDIGFARADANLEKLAIMVADGFADTARKSDMQNLGKKWIL